MIHPCEMSQVTKRYLSRFYEILDEMIQEMTGAALTDSISHNFIVQMTPHHKAAIEMSQNILQYTTFIPVQKIACNIIEEQTKSIENMTDALGRCSALTNTDQELASYQRCFSQITRAMFADMQIACADNDINANFMREMIPHHEGAVRMSENALRFSLCQELPPILTSITSTQKAGIQKMEHLLRCMRT